MVCYRHSILLSVPIRCTFSHITLVTYYRDSKLLHRSSDLLPVVFLVSQGPLGGSTATLPPIAFSDIVAHLTHAQPPSPPPKKRTGNFSRRGGLKRKAFFIGHFRKGQRRSKHAQICTTPFEYKGWSSPARGYKFWCVCSYMAGHEDAGVMTGHIGTNAPKCVPPRWGRPLFGSTQTGLCKFGRAWSALKGPRFPGFSKTSFSKLRALGSAIWRVRQDTFAERVRVRQENTTATWGSARSTLSKILAFRKIIFKILLNLLWGVLLRFLFQLACRIPDNFRAHAKGVVLLKMRVSAF